jgi:quercetin dioxygenase-like cupin family protein
MTAFGEFEAPDPGFHMLAGPAHGLRRVVFAGGRFPAGDYGPVHQHSGDELLRIVSGELLVRVGDERRTCRAGDLVIIPPDTPHGFRAIQETVLEVVAEQDMGTLFQIREPDGSRKLVATYRPELPWNPPPPSPGAYTTDEEMAEIFSKIETDV